MDMIYFDNSATTAPYPSVIEEMTRTLTEEWGNPSSVHTVGIHARSVLDESRRRVARALGIRREEEGRVIFTSSGTEADQLAILGSVYAKRRPERNGSRGKILTTDSEHPAVEECMKRLEADGFTVCRVPTRGGILDMNFIRENADGAILASFMLVNNESGAHYDVKTAFSFVRALSPDCVTHTDAVQGFGKVRFTPAMLGADMVTVSAHKIGGPKGIGALYIAPHLRNPRPLLPGGGQEFTLRSGTEATAQIAGFAKAVELRTANYDQIIAQLTELKAYCREKLSQIPTLVEIGKGEAPHILAISLPGYPSANVVTELGEQGICISAGSACHKGKSSHVVSALGLDKRTAAGVLRLSFGPETTREDIDAVCDALQRHKEQRFAML